ncbi:IS66-like element accessory protein TnpA [Methylobacterium nodulans]|nr:transposase [Methylobacterium nodulans]
MSEPVRRLELFTGAGRRRTWSEDEKAAIVAESEAPNTSISAVARRHGLSASQLFTWRRLARQAAMDDQQAELRFVPAVLISEPQEPACAETSPKPRWRHGCHGIEVEVAGATVRIGGEASEAQIAAVIRALKVSA